MEENQDNQISLVPPNIEVEPPQRQSAALLSPPHSVPPLEAHSAAAASSRALSGSHSQRRGGRRQAYWRHHWEEIGSGQAKSWQCKNCGAVIDTDHATKQAQHNVRCFAMSTPERENISVRCKALSRERVQSRSSVDDETLAKQELIDFEESTSGVRRISRSSLDKEHPLYKRIKLDIPTIEQCSAGEANEINKLLIAAICERGWPFSLVEKHDGQDNLFVQLLRKLRPGYVDKFLPSSQKLSGELLDSYYNEVKEVAFSGMQSRLQSGYATVMFDAWEDVNSSTVVNVLLRSEGQQRSQQLTFFVESVFTGSTSTGAAKYVQVVENAVEALGGMTRICGVVSDNAQACVNARKALTLKYKGLVGIQDQAHVSDLLMEDFGKIQWIKVVLSRIAHIISETRNHKLFLSRLKMLMNGYNDSLRNRGALRSKANGDSDEDLTNFSAILPRRHCVTRFAVVEDMLESYIRCLPVLQKLIGEPDYRTLLYRTRSHKAEEERVNFFDNAIKDVELLEEAQDIRRVLRVVRKYLRHWDSDSCSIADVLPRTMQLERDLSQIAPGKHLFPARKQELLDVFMSRKQKRENSQNSRRMKVYLLDNIHYAAYLLDPVQCPRDTTPLMEPFKTHLRQYCSARTFEESIDLMHTILRQYDAQVMRWHDQSSMNVDNVKYLQQYRGAPLVWWRRAADQRNRELVEFACRTLSCSPSSCAAERSFSAQGRLHNKFRSRLSERRTQMIIFAHWNARLLRKVSAVSDMMFWNSVFESDGDNLEQEIQTSRLLECVIGEEGEQIETLRTVSPENSINSGPLPGMTTTAFPGSSQVLPSEETGSRRVGNADGLISGNVAGSPLMSTVTSQAMQSAFAALSNPSTLFAAAHLGAQLQNIRSNFAPNMLGAVQSNNASQEPTAGGRKGGASSSLQPTQNSGEQQDGHEP